MKGSRAKKAAEAAAAEAAGAAELTPSPPTGAREGGPRPGPIVQSSGESVQMPADVFAKLCQQLRTSELLGAAAADAFEAAAGLRPVASPQCKAAQDLRSNVAESREAADEKPASPKKKKGMNFAAGPVEEIPDLPEAPPVKRASISEADAVDHDVEAMEAHPEKDAAEPPELNLTPKQNHMRTDLEMWVMDEIPPLFGVDDSEELAEELQEDGQADKLTFLIAQTDEAAQAQMADDWLKDCPDADAKQAFSSQLLEKVRAIQALSPKKKKKKKKVAAPADADS